MPDKFDNIEIIRVLYEISTLIQSDSELEDKFNRALAMIRDAVGCHSASLFIYEEESGKLEEVATVGKLVELIEAVDFDMGKGFSAWVAKNRRSVLIPNLRKKQHEGFRSFVSIPLISLNRLIGVMNLGHEEPNAFTEKHMNFLEIIAGQMAHTIEHADFENELIRKNVALVEAKKEIESHQQKIIEMEKYQVLGQVAVSINHEINNPLTTIMGNIELIMMADSSMSEAIHKKLGIMLEECKRIAKVTEKLKDIKQVVVKDYLEKYGEKMIDINSSSKSDEEEKLS
ncbi:GAF domain-containing protein [Candidatus Latescibacterota bacterium]